MPFKTPTFVRLSLNEEEWERKIEVDENSIRLRRIKGYKKPLQFEWQWDGETFTCAPGEEIVVAKDVALAGLRSSRVFPRDRDENGVELMAYDHLGTMYPMLEVLEEFDATNPTTFAAVPPQKQQRCPFCRTVVDDLETHLPSCPKSGLAGEKIQQESGLADPMDRIKDNLNKSLEALQNA